MRKLFILLLSLVLPTILFAQSMSVKSFRLLETDLDANTAGLSKTDQNGETAALIKVVTNQTGFTFDGGSLSIVATKQTPGEIWVYIPRGSKKITIKHSQLGVLRDYFFPCPIEAARTYEMILITGSVQTIVNEDAGGQYLVMTVNPPTATVYIDDKEATLQEGALSNFLSYGKHTYRISDPLYETDAGTFEIGKEKKEIKINLSPSYGILDVSTSPENGAKVFLDNNTDPIGVTPFSTKKISKGQHKFRFQMSEYDTKTITHEVHSDGTNKPLVVALNPNYANITINTPENCELFINNESKGKGVWKGRLSEGLYRLEARRAGHSSTSQTLSVTKGEEQAISMQSPTPIYGGLNINSTPIDATIIIDGENKGTTPIIIQDVLIGEHNITLEKKGYEPKTQQIKVEKGKISEINFSLEKEIAKTEEKDSNTNKATNNNSTTISSNYTAEELSQLKNRYKKDPEQLIKIGRQLLDHNQIEEAKAFANYANESSKPKYQFVPAYLLLGDIETKLGKDAGKAASYYAQAITFAPKDPEGYIKWAMVTREINPSWAVNKLQELKKQRPDIDTDALMAHIYMLANNDKQAYEYFAKADINKLNKDYLNEFARASYFTGHFQDALRAAEAGLKIEPRNAVFNRLAMFSNYELKNYEAAKNYIQKYFNETDAPKISEYDHFYAALIYQALGENEKMYSHYKKALELTGESSLLKRWSILKTISDSYLKDKDYEKAISTYEEYLRCKPELNYDDYESMAQIYSKYADNDNNKKSEMIENAITIYRSLYDNYPNNKAYSAFMCGGLSNKLDVNMANGLAKNYYQKVIDLLEYNYSRTKGEDTMLKTSYHYMMYYSFMHKDTKGAKDYAKKILAIDPGYKPAIEVNKLN